MRVHLCSKPPASGPLLQPPQETHQPGPGSARGTPPFCFPSSSGLATRRWSSEHNSLLPDRLQPPGTPALSWQPMCSGHWGPSAALCHPGDGALPNMFRVKLETGARSPPGWGLETTGGLVVDEHCPPQVLRAAPPLTLQVLQGGVVLLRGPAPIPGHSLWTPGQLPLGQALTRLNLSSGFGLVSSWALPPPEGT